MWLNQNCYIGYTPPPTSCSTPLHWLCYTSTKIAAHFLISVMCITFVSRVYLNNAVLNSGVSFHTLLYQLSYTLVLFPKRGYCTWREVLGLQWSKSQHPLETCGEDRVTWYPHIISGCHSKRKRKFNLEHSFGVEFWAFHILPLPFRVWFAGLMSIVRTVICSVIVRPIVVAILRTLWAYFFFTIWGIKVQRSWYVELVKRTVLLNFYETIEANIRIDLTTAHWSRTFSEPV
jgi:hypothetical protein